MIFLLAYSDGDSCFALSCALSLSFDLSCALSASFALSWGLPQRPLLSSARSASLPQPLLPSKSLLPWLFAAWPAAGYGLSTPPPSGLERDLPFVFSSPRGW